MLDRLLRMIWLLGVPLGLLGAAAVIAYARTVARRSRHCSRGDGRTGNPAAGSDRSRRRQQLGGDRARGAGHPQRRVRRLPAEPACCSRPARSQRDHCLVSVGRGRVLRRPADDTDGLQRSRTRSRMRRPAPNRRKAQLPRCPSEPTRDALLVEAFLDQELEGRPRAASRIEHPVHLPLGQEAVVLPARGRPVGELRQVLELPRERDSLLDSPLEPLLPDRDVEARFAQRLGEGTEGVPVERLRRHRPSSRVEILCGRHAAEVLPQLAQEPDELLACGEAAGNEAGLSLSRVPAAEVLDDRLRVNGRVRVCRELAHGRRAAEPFGRRAQLVEDLIVRVPLPDSGLE